MSGQRTYRYLEKDKQILNNKKSFRHISSEYDSQYDNVDLGSAR